MRYPHQRPTPQLPGNWKDATLVAQADLDAATGPVTETWQPVWVRRAGWHPGILTAWRQVRQGDWAALVQWGPTPEETAWLMYKAVAIRPIQPPADGEDPDPGQQ